MASTSPEFVSMLNYLQERGKAPEMSAVGLPVGTGGNYRIKDNSMRFNSGLFQQLNNDQRNRAQEFKNIAAHEMTHAVQQDYKTRYEEIKNNKELQTPENLQWAQGYEKLIENKNIDYGNKGAVPLRELLKKLNPQWQNENFSYRSNDIEAPAWAVGLMQGPSRIFGSSDMAAPPHIDSTLATEQAILLELARRKKTNGK